MFSELKRWNLSPLKIAKRRRKVRDDRLIIISKVTWVTKQDCTATRNFPPLLKTGKVPSTAHCSLSQHAEQLVSQQHYQVLIVMRNYLYRWYDGINTWPSVFTLHSEKIKTPNTSDRDSRIPARNNDAIIRTQQPLKY